MVEGSLDGIRVFRVPYLHVYPIHVKVHQVFQNRLLKSLEADLDLIHVHHPLTPLFRTSLPVVVTAHSSLGLPGAIEQQGFYSGTKLPNEFLAIMRWYSGHIERGTIESADQVTAVSRAIADELLSRYGRRSTGQIEVLGNGVDVDLFTPGVPSDNTSILYTGRLSWSKGLTDLVKSAKLILDQQPDTSFRLAGEGTLKTELKRMVGDIGLSGKFTFLGNLDLRQLIKCYQAATVFVLPSYYEGLPTSLLEAMACGVPVVTTNVGSIPEIVQNNQNGIIVPKGDPRAIAEAVLNLLKDKQKRLRIGRAARKTVELRYDWNKLVDRLIGYYKEPSKEWTAGPTGPV
jgi:glycosyltransferase involved in cell wall biosynthesis